MLSMHFVHRLLIIPTDPLYNITHRKHNEPHCPPASALCARRPRSRTDVPPLSSFLRRAPTRRGGQPVAVILNKEDAGAQVRPEDAAGDLGLAGRSDAKVRFTVRFEHAAGCPH